MEAIKKVYYYQKGKNLPIYGVQTPNLAKYTTSANDIKIGVSRRPPANQRRKSQDLFDESTSEADYQMDFDEEFTLNEM